VPVELCVDEAQGGVDRDTRDRGPGEDLMDVRHLLTDAFAEVRSITTADHEPNVGDQAGIALGINHPDAAGGDNEMVDVRSRLWPASVVQDEQASAHHHRVEGGSELLLADGSFGVRRPGVVRTVDRVRKPPQERSTFDALKASVLLLNVKPLASGASGGARNAPGDLGRHLDASQAGHRSGRSIPGRLGTSVEWLRAAHAGGGTAQLDDPPSHPSSVTGSRRGDCSSLDIFT
jgi:hypothetical protein